MSRASFYRHPAAAPGANPDRKRRDAMQRRALEFCSYGRPRITAELQRRGGEGNPQRVPRILREDNRRCLRRRKFVLPTASGHDRRVYPNWARPRVLTDVEQLWRADITYVRRQEEFVFLAVIRDGYSRRVMGWALDRTLESGWARTALRRALSRRSLGPGWVHPSDRGVP